MDPLSILGITASTVQFMDFGSRLLSTLIDVSRGPDESKALAEVEKLDRDSRDLVDICEAIETRITSFGQSDRPLTATETVILEESRHCLAIGHEISASLDKFLRNVQKEANMSTLDKISDAFSLVWNGKSINGMKRKLAEPRSKLMLAMISNLWERSGPEEVPTLESARHQTLVEQLRSEDQVKVDDLSPVHSLFTYHQTKARHGNSTSAGKDAGANDAKYVDALLSSLHFIALDNRLQAIPKAYKSTFEWVLQQPRLSEDTAQPLWSSFPDWLDQDSENIYWITGKPGSGKSTLMKHLAAQPETLSHLERWSGHRKVLIATFYSWDAGSDLQKSQVGFLRTLLYQIVEKAPELAPKLLPGRWAMQKLFGSASLQHLPPWTWEELFQSIVSLTMLSDRKFNLAIFVDGLDEFSGDHSRLIDLVRQFHSQPGVKVCVSSRPWNDFRDAFVSCPQLKMEVLTENDLKTFVHGVAYENVAFMELKDVYPSEAEDLLSKVVDRAGGVFLWVSLVMKALLNALTDGETLIYLEQLIDSLPEDLSRLYASLWRRVKHKYKRDGSRLLLLFRTYTSSPILDLKGMKLVMPAGMEAEMLWLAEGNRPERSERLLQILRRQLSSRTMGLLEIAKSGQVNYLHRTTKEWLDTFWPEMESSAPGHFDPHLGLLRAISRTASNDSNSTRNKFKMKRGPGASWEAFCNMWGWILEAFYHAGKVVDDPQDRLVDALDRVESSFRNMRLVTTTMVSQPPHWATVSRGSAKEFGFVGIAAEFGVVRYVRAKLAESSDYLSIEGDEEDLLSCLLLGPGSRGLPRREYKSLGNTPFRNRFDCIQEFVFDHVSFNPAGRYEVAENILDMLGETNRKGKIPTALRHRLAPLAERVEIRNDRGWPHTESGQALVEAGKGQIPYGQAVVELLEKYGIGQKSGGMRESVKAWIQWKLDSLGVE